NEDYPRPIYAARPGHRCRPGTSDRSAGKKLKGITISTDGGYFKDPRSRRLRSRFVGLIVTERTHAGQAKPLHPLPDDRPVIYQLLPSQKPTSGHSDFPDIAAAAG